MDIPTPTLFRQTLSRFATGVSILTACNTNGFSSENHLDNGFCQKTHLNKNCRGMTINSLTSVSLDPPLVLFCLKTNSPRYDFFKECTNYAISVLNHEQQHLADHFARHGTFDEQAFALLESHSIKKAINHSENSAPLFQGSLAHLKGVQEALYKGGDHTIFTVRITHLAFDTIKKPLLFYASQYHTLEE